MADARNIMTAGTHASFATDLFCSPNTDQNSFQMLNGLYKELEPQLCKSYRRHVMYIPTTPERRVPVTINEKKKNKLKAVNMAIDVVSELQRKKDTAKAKKDAVRLDFKEIAGKATDLPKATSQSLPNLLETSKS